MAKRADYEEYGASFRQPRQTRDDGGPANNSFNQYDGDTGRGSRPEGRPRRQDVDRARRGFGAEDDTEQPQQQQQTFRQMQAQGVARPPAPTPVRRNPMQGDYVNPHQGGGVWQPPGGQYGPPPKPPAGGGLEGELRGAYQNYQGPAGFAARAGRTAAPQAFRGERFSGSAARANLPRAFAGQQFGGQYDARQAPGARITGQFNAPQSRVNPALEESVMRGLKNPSRWDEPLIKSTYDRLAGGLDDEYNARDQALTGSMARRGLGAVGDSTVGANDARYLNLQRRTAKGDALQNVMENAANTQATDRAQAISAGMGYAGQEFEQGLSGYEANRGTNAQNYGMEMEGARFGADEAKSAYDRSFARQDFNNRVGQQAYENEYDQSQYTDSMNQRDLENSFRNTGYNNQVGQQGYENEFRGAEFNQGQNQQEYANEANNYAMSQAAQQQGFNNKQQLLDKLLGYGQQSFQNQFATNEARQRQQQQEYENMLKMMGY